MTIQVNRAAMTAHLLGEASGPLTGIYLITHRATGMRYVGQSVNILSRWASHRHPEGNARLAQAVVRDGKDAFQFEIVELCAPEELDDRETFYIWGFDSLYPAGFNHNLGRGGSRVSIDELYAKNREELARATAMLDQDPALLSQLREAAARLQSSLVGAAS